MSCPLCLSPDIKPQADVKHLQLIHKYWLCNECGLIFLDPQDHLSPEEEKSRYDFHQNDLSDPRYTEYLQRFIDPLKFYLKSGMTGVDFGCGPVPGLAQLLSKEGLRMEAYDPYYFSSEEVLNQTYDLVACCEAAEHFYEPRNEFNLFHRMLKPGGYLAIQTQLYDESINLAQWWYARDPTHVSIYQRKTFDWIAGWKGWKVVGQPKNMVIFQNR